MITPENARKHARSVDEWLADNGGSWADIGSWLPDRHADTERRGPRRPGRGPAWKSGEERPR